jgi:hypothetical protein
MKSEISHEVYLFILYFITSNKFIFLSLSDVC